MTKENNYEMQTKAKTVNDFFCGCGGFAVGFKAAGFEIVGAWDFDKYAVETYRANIGDHVKQADVSKMTAADIPKATVWTFGFPCQDLSVAGKMKGMKLACQDCKCEWKAEKEEDTVCPSCGSKNYKAASRSGLFFEMMRLLDETAEENKPLYLVAENVKGLKPYIPILEEEYRKRGYTPHIKLFNSKYHGVPQNRERYYIVGTKDSADLKFEFHEENKTNIPKLSTILEENVDEKFYIADEKAEKIIKQAEEKLSKAGKVHATITPDRVEKRQNGRRAKEDEEEMFTLTAQDRHGVMELDDSLHGVSFRPQSTSWGGGVLYENEMGACCARDYKDPCRVIEEQPTIKCIGELEGRGYKQIRRVYSPEGISPTLDTCGGGNTQAKILTDDGPKMLTPNNWNHKAGDGVSTRSRNISEIHPALQANEGGTQKSYLYHRYRVRKLTPTEYGRLQGFPMDTWEQVVSNSQAYKQFGNAVTTFVAQDVAESILESMGEAVETETSKSDIEEETKKTENPKLIAVVDDKFPGSRAPRIYTETSPTITTSDSLKTIVAVASTQKNATVTEDDTKQPDGGYVGKKLAEFTEKNGYIPDRFEAYNCREIKELHPTLTANANLTSSGTVLLIDKPEAQKKTLSDYTTEELLSEIIRRVSAV